jgi:DNA/RNA-binding domain of Phe-tRNA-synthetase-like protein
MWRQLYYRALTLATTPSPRCKSTFDFDRIQPPIILRVGQPGETYSGIGRGEIKIEGLAVFADQLGPFGSTTSDSERTMVRLETAKILMVVISFMGSEGMEGVVGRTAGLLVKYAGAATNQYGWRRTWASNNSTFPIPCISSNR